MRPDCAMPLKGDEKVNFDAGRDHHQIHLRHLRQAREEDFLLCNLNQTCK